MNTKGTQVPILFFVFVFKGSNKFVFSRVNQCFDLAVWKAGVFRRHSDIPRRPTHLKCRLLRPRKFVVNRPFTSFSRGRIMTSDYERNGNSKLFILCSRSISVQLKHRKGLRPICCLICWFDHHHHDHDPLYNCNEFINWNTATSRFLVEHRAPPQATHPDDGCWASARVWGRGGGSTFFTFGISGERPKLSTHILYTRKPKKNKIKT